MVFDPTDAINAAKDIATNAIKKAADIAEDAGHVLSGDVVEGATAIVQTPSPSLLMRWSAPLESSLVAATP
jgi:hypothetical protein